VHVATNRGPAPAQADERCAVTDQSIPPRPTHPSTEDGRVRAWHQVNPDGSLPPVGRNYSRLGSGRVHPRCLMLPFVDHADRGASSGPSHPSAGSTGAVGCWSTRRSAHRVGGAFGAVPADLDSAENRS